MSKSENPVDRWHAGVWRIAQRELAGEPVPPAWDAACDALEQQCRELEDRKRARAVGANVREGAST